jgi:hypothetical protein
MKDTLSGKVRHMEANIPKSILMSTPQKSISFAEDREDTEEDVTAVKSFSPASTSKKASSNTKKKLNKETKKSPIQLKTNDKDDRVLDRWLDHFFEGEVRQTLPEGLDDEDSGSDSTSAEELAESSRLRETLYEEDGDDGDSTTSSSEEEQHDEDEEEASHMNEEELYLMAQKELRVIDETSLLDEEGSFAGALGSHEADFNPVY